MNDELQLALFPFASLSMQKVVRNSLFNPLAMERGTSIWDDSPFTVTYIREVGTQCLLVSSVVVLAGLM